jgi:2-polyprenyl-3-methyl-5-hydroxy-6-metoxy-1,4-benzoquinol methylase
VASISGLDFDIKVLNASHLSQLAKSLYTDGPFIQRTLQHWRPHICPFEKIISYAHNGARVLDIGCGSGLLLNMMAGLGLEFEGIGLDVSHSAIDVARRVAKRLCAMGSKARLSFEVLDAENVWSSEPFDVVFLIDVLHHIPPRDQRRFLDRVISKVGERGIFVYKDMCNSPWWKALANRLHDLIIARELISYVSISQIAEWANARSMEVIFREDITRFWYGHEFMILKRAVTQK